MKLVAVGVADTGHGLREEDLEAAKYAISTSTSSAKSHGAQNTGFGLYHAHLQTRALSTELRLSSLDKCRDLLNEDMKNALTEHEASRRSDSTHHSSVPGKGTVLYFTIPVVRSIVSQKFRVYPTASVCSFPCILDIIPHALLFVCSRLCAVQGLR